MHHPPQIDQLRLHRVRNRQSASNTYCILGSYILRSCWCCCLLILPQLLCYLARCLVACGAAPVNALTIQTAEPHSPAAKAALQLDTVCCCLAARSTRCLILDRQCCLHQLCCRAHALSTAASCWVCCCSTWAVHPCSASIANSALLVPSTIRPGTKMGACDIAKGFSVHFARAHFFQFHDCAKT